MNEEVFADVVDKKLQSAVNLTNAEIFAEMVNRAGLPLRYERECLISKVIDPMIAYVHQLIAQVNEIEGKDGLGTQVKYLCVAGGLSSSKYFQPCNWSQPHNEFSHFR